MERDALWFSDGSFSVFAEGRPMDKIKEDRAECDKNQDDPAHMTKVARVKIEIVEVLIDPTLSFGEVVSDEEFDKLIMLLERPGAASETILRGAALLRKMRAKR